MDTKNLDIYGSAPLAWTRVHRQLEAGDSKGSYWLATTRPDGRPHVAGVGAVWVDEKFYFVSGAATRKSQNLAENPNCVLSVSLPDLDLVVEGTAAIVRDPSTLARLAERYASGGWPAEVSAPGRPIHRPGIDKSAGAHHGAAIEGAAEDAGRAERVRDRHCSVARCRRRVRCPSKT